MKDNVRQPKLGLEAVVDDMPFDVWIKGINGKYIDVNKHFAEACGKSKEDIIGKNDYDLYTKAVADIYTASDKATVLRKTPGHYEAEVETGKFKEEFKEPLFDETGKLIATAGFSRDITERILLSQALAESERSKSMLLSNLPGVAYRCDADSKWAMNYLSEGCYDLTGYTADELLAQEPSYYDLIPSDYRSRLFIQRKEDLTYYRTSANEYPIRTASGAIKWVWGKSKGVYDSNNKLIAIEGFIIDVTERKHAEVALKESEERFRTLFEEAPLGIGIIDFSTGRAYQINRMFAEIVGKTKEEALAMNWKNFMTLEEIEEKLHGPDNFDNFKIPSFSVTKRFMKQDGAFIWINLTITNYKTELHSTPAHLCMIKDITAQKQVEDQNHYLIYHDQLTGLYNRRFYEEELRKIDEESNLPITLAICDVNGLRLINEAFGHSQGDMLLKRISEIMKHECKTEDFLARIDGDEFILVLRKTNSSQAEKLIMRLKKAIESTNSDGICSVSFGWETKRNGSEDIKKIYAFAENHLHRNKRSETAHLKDDAIKVIASTLYQKNKREQLHCDRVSRLCEEIGIAMGMDSHELAQLKTAGLLHDIGKIGIDEKLLNKEGKLTEFEWLDVKRHPEIGYYILKEAKPFVSIAEYVLYHHERMDGKGYPRGLVGEEIPLQSRIICIADAYDAMTGTRTYKKVMNKWSAIKEIKANSGSQFDSSIARLFVEKVLQIEWSSIG